MTIRAHGPSLPVRNARRVPLHVLAGDPPVGEDADTVIPLPESDVDVLLIGIGEIVQQGQDLPGDIYRSYRRAPT